MSNLSIDGIPATDFSVLKKLTKPAYFYCDAEGFADALVLKGLKALEYVYVPNAMQNREKMEKLLPKGCSYGDTKGMREQDASEH